MNRLPVTKTEIENVVRGFETVKLIRTDFQHPEHLAVAVWYVHTLGTRCGTRTHAIRLVALSGPSWSGPREV